MSIWSEADRQKTQLSNDEEIKPLNNEVFGADICEEAESVLTSSQDMMMAGGGGLIDQLSEMVVSDRHQSGELDDTRKVCS
ncbi:hypothetical protein KIN20_004142 [Parelaphostrongylus tenuis]|uniref:Uncharacterized protein n=1 Tax=Parelaphostrongylus tenuis TaxID=148309 RepID=A0AAD5MGK6_PARTN|nr:hypothetical protein KIN20_004142 [Parelaphostrongylus tenuis]